MRIDLSAHIAIPRALVAGFLFACLWPLASCSRPTPTSSPGEAARGLPPLSEEERHALPASLPETPNPHAGKPASPHGNDTNGTQGAIIKGTVELAPELAGAQQDGVIFISVKAKDPQSGAVLPTTVAVDRMELSGFPLSFEIAVPRQGAVLLTARLDRDGDAGTRNPLDIEGSVELSVPQDEAIRLVLSRVI